jgi:hypothetical protein
MYNYSTVIKCQGRGSDMKMENSTDGNLHFFAVRIPNNILFKFDCAVKMYGKKKQKCVEEALDIFSDKIIAEYLGHERDNKIIRVKY